MLPSTKRLKAIIAEAMPPAMKRELKASGQLEKVLTDRASQAEDSYQTAFSQAMTVALEKDDYQEKVSGLMQDRNEAARVALDQAVEFETPAEEQTSERRPEA